MTIRQNASHARGLWTEALLLFPILMLLHPVSVAGQGTAPERPNIVILFSDDLGYGEIGPHNPTEIPTPNIDAIAESGIRFTDGYVTAPNCSASRAGFLTGRYQTRFGHEFNPTKAKHDDPRAAIPQSEVTLAELLRDVGYTTGLMGKWHLGGTLGAHPMRHGFDEFFGFLHEGHYFVPPPYEGVTTWLRRKALPDWGEAQSASEDQDRGRLPETSHLAPGERRWISDDGRLIYSTVLPTNEPAYDAGNPIIRNGQPVEEDEYLTDAITRESVDFIDRHADKPFFLFASYNAVHSPMQATDAYMEEFEHIDNIHRRIFAGMLSHLDAGVGTIMQKLRDEGLEENTLVFFISDNGGPTRELTSSNEPLRGGKGDMYEGGVRIPYLMQWKGHLPEGTVERRPVSSVDVYATAAALAGAALPDDRTIDGVDLMPYLRGEEEGRPHDVLFWRQGAKTAVRVQDWKLVQNDRSERSAHDWELFNLAEDLGERNDLALTRPEKVQELRAIWARLNSEMVEPNWDRSMSLLDAYPNVTGE